MKGHPVHYVISHYSEISKNLIVQSLIDSLYYNKRVKSKRFIEIVLDDATYMPKSDIEELYHIFDESTIVIYLGSRTDEETIYGDKVLSILTDLCNYANVHKNNVLTIFAVHNKDEKSRHIISENMPNIALIDLKQGIAWNDDARKYLASQAEKFEIQSDTSLIKKVKSDTGYTISDLDIIFDEWYNKQLTQTLFPQYSNFFVEAKKAQTNGAKGLAIKELDNMIGLNSAKKQIHDIINFFKAQKMYKDKGFTAERPAMHMVFTGSPGTAKTTVARLVAQIMKDNGLLSDGELYEVGRSDLVGKYVGWTAKIVKEKFKRAKGSILFIDEAYSLIDRHNGLFGDEAINTIVQEMENNRENMIVIFAGYPDKMEEFLSRNPGLKSRIAFNVNFDDYNENELFEILKYMADKKEIILDKSVENKVVDNFKNVKNQTDFGNGRYVRNLFQKAIMKQSTRLMAIDYDQITKKDIQTLTADDFDVEIVKKEVTARKIGFALNEVS